jgi:hypothetical protein
MPREKTAKPATADTVNGLRNFEQLGGRLDLENSPDHRARQVLRLTRKFGFPFETAEVVASLAWGMER